MPHRLNMPRQIPRMIPNPLERLQDKRRLERNIEMPGILHRAREQPPQPGRILLIEITIPGNDFIRNRELDTVERIQRQPQQTYSKPPKMTCIARGGRARTTAVSKNSSRNLRGFIPRP